MLLVAEDIVAALPGLGEVGGLLTVLLASLKSSNQKGVSSFRNIIQEKV